MTHHCQTATMRILTAEISGLNGDYPPREVMALLFVSFVWMGICPPYLIALPHVSGAVPRRYQRGSIYMEIKAVAEVE